MKTFIPTYTTIAKFQCGRGQDNLITGRYFQTSELKVFVVHAIHSLQSTFIHIVLILDSFNSTRSRKQTKLKAS